MMSSKLTPPEDQQKTGFVISDLWAIWVVYVSAKNCEYL